VKNQIKKRSLTGIKPSGTFHLGNYLGAVRPALSLIEQNYECFYFIANYHALTSVMNQKELEDYTYSITASWLSFNTLNKGVTVYLQSDVPEIFELSWILSCFTSKGLLDRAHAYKDALAKNANVSNGLYTYPVLMAADILAFDVDVVPVGRDQKQHIEIARDIASAVNNNYGKPVLKLPESLIQENVETIPGLDGEKMSKSKNNVIPVFEDEKKIKKLVNSIVTDCSTVEDKKDPDKCTIFKIYSCFANADEILALRNKYTAGGMGWGEAKSTLFNKLMEHFAEPRKRYIELMNNKDHIRNILRQGSIKAREHAGQVLGRVKNAIGAI